MTWSVGFVLNVVLIVTVPLLAFLSSEFPSVREALFSWLTPALRDVTSY